MADTPYGVTGEPWDIAWEEDDLSQILKQIAACNAAKNWSICLWHTPKQTAMFLDVLEANGYKEPVHLYWHKTDHATHATPVASYTSSMEMCTIWFYPSRACRVYTQSTQGSSPTSQFLRASSSHEKI